MREGKANLLSYRIPAHAGNGDVENHCIRTKRSHRRKYVSSNKYAVDDVSLVAQDQREHLDRIAIIISNENSERGTRLACGDDFCGRCFRGHRLKAFVVGS